MPSILNEIGAFQFDNLVNNRIPFLLVNLGIDVAGLFKGAFQTHLEQNMLLTEAKDAVAAVQAKKYPKDFAIVVLCGTGEGSEKVVDLLEAAGHTNVFFIKGGLHALIAERG